MKCLNILEDIWSSNVHLKQKGKAECFSKDVSSDNRREKKKQSNIRYKIDKTHQFGSGLEEEKHPCHYDSYLVTGNIAAQMLENIILSL